MKEKFARYDLLFLEYLKRDWKKIIIWVVALASFAAGFAPYFVEIAKGDGKAGLFETMQNPAIIAMVGPTPIKNAIEYTVGAMYAHEMLLFSCIFSMIVSLLHVIKHTRKEEELGLCELVRSFQVGRQANSLAVMIETSIINVLLSFAITAMLVSFRIETITFGGSLLFGLSIGTAGIIGAAIALLMSQIMPTSQSAIGSSIGILGLLYILRAATDVSNITLSKINPLGFSYLTHPYTENNWYFLAFAILLIFALVIIAFVLEGKRDMGAGYIPQKEGRMGAKKSLLSTFGLLFRLNRGSIISGFIGLFILAGAYGSIFGDMQTFLESSEIIKQMFTISGVSIEKSFTSTLIFVMAVLVAILPIVIVNRLYTEETRGRLSQIYSTKVKRSKLYFTTVILATLCGVIGLLLSSLGLALTALTAMASTDLTIQTIIYAGLNFVPSILFFVGLSSLALGFAPKLGKAVYIYLAYSFIINYFGKIISMPKWVPKTTIHSYIPLMPVDNFCIVKFAVISVISCVLIILGFVGYNKRDMYESA